MKYILVLGIIFEKYKNPAKIKITTDQSLIDEFYLDQDKNPTFDFLDKITHHKEKMYKKHNQARLDKQFINQEWPTYFRVYQLQRLPLGDRIKIEVENPNSDYTNGFMRNSSLIKFPVIAFFPKSLCMNNSSSLMNFMLNNEDGLDRHITRKGEKSWSELSTVDKFGMWMQKKRGSSKRLGRPKIMEGKKIKNTWPAKYVFYINKSDEYEKSKKVSGHEPIGGSFTIDFLVKRKHNIDYIYQDIEQSDIGFWASRDASSLLLASCGQLLNIYNEDYRSDTT